MSKKARRLAKEARDARRYPACSPITHSESDGPHSVTCAHCNTKTTNLEGHLDHRHINQVTIEVWPGELLTVNRSGGVFHCPWCADKTRKLSSARAMEVSHSVPFPPAGPELSPSRTTSETATHTTHI